MEFGLSEEQQLLKDSIARFVEREYSFDQRQRLVTEGGGFSTANWRIFSDMGWLMLGIPESKGGLGGSVVDTAIVMEEFGKALVVEPFLHAAILAARVLIEARDESGLVEAIGSGEAMPVLAHGEADAVGDRHRQSAADDDSLGCPAGVGAAEAGADPAGDGQGQQYRHEGDRNPD